MIISLYLDDKIVNFKLPTIVSGSYTFDYDEEYDGSLINIDGKNKRWVLYSTDDVKIMNFDQYTESAELEHNRFYTLRRDNKDYLIYVYSVSETNMIAYSYYSNSTINISKSNTNFSYDCNYIGGGTVQISFKDGIKVINAAKTKLYINKYIINSSELFLKPGDTLELFGLRIIFLAEMILINNLKEKLKIDTNSAGLKNRNFLSEEPPKEIEVKNVDLYGKDDYFSKSPRIRRTIESREIKLATPPKDGESRQMPLILTIGPMLTMAITSVTMVANIMIKISNKETTFKASWPQIVTSGVMLISMLVWPLVTQWYNKRMQKKKKEEIHKKYLEYLNEKRTELQEEARLQKVILYENLLTLEDCLNNLKRKNINFWDKRLDQSDFLTVRLGLGDEKLAVDINYSEEDFTVEENDLRNEADKLIEEFKYIHNVPLGYSFSENVLTDIMGQEYMVINFMNNILLQILTFYSYEELKLVVFTTEANEKKWEYIKFLNHNFDDSKDFRFFASNQEESKVLCEYLSYEVNNRINIEQDNYKPHYLIIIDGYDNVKHYDLINTISETEKNINMSAIILENRLSKLPSKCNRFIIVEQSSATLLKNSFEKQEQVKFMPEIHYNLNMLALTKSLSNIPIEFENTFSQLPESITFMEMEKVGKVEQLNILNRWNTNDSTASLRAEVGVDASGDLMYLDLHEKYHGPHGLIAGTTGSGKSEFIITYILSMAINYSPDDISFILIDYKGGGLALAFENKTTGISLPHLAGTITNLDKAEMARTLVSIDSEVKRRQMMFNNARDKLGESTIDIYKYQKFYKEGKVEEPIPHLFIICDEFAELKSQQPDFMDNLISVARIGRSLGVHLILATQKPSGVVNDQIWSNTRFRVCLKVQDEADSKEMLKRPEAAHIKQSGRFYLQVGYDEYFALGQSGWAGAKYYSYDKVIKQVDKSVNFINNYGANIKSIQAANNIKVEPQGEQLAAVMNSIIEVSDMVSKKCKRLWLENIPAIIVQDELEKKYDYIADSSDIEVIIGEYDAPEKQEQGVVKYNFIKNGNTLVYGSSSSEIEMLLNTLIYATSKNFSSSDINFYIIDYGSESFRKYLPLPHVGGVVFQNDDEEYYNLLKMIREEIAKRKEMFVEYGGQYTNYIKNSGKKIPIKVVIINNYDSLYSSHNDIFDNLPDLVRDSERYGIVFWITGSATNSIHSKITSSCLNNYAFKLKDVSDYATIFGKKLDNPPADIEGRGVLKHEIAHLFQVSSITDNPDTVDEYLINYIKEKKQQDKLGAYKIPILPNKVSFDKVKDYITSKSRIPIGISKKDLEVMQMDFASNIGNIISSNKITNTVTFSKSLLTSMTFFKGIFLVVMDPNNMLDSIKERFANYYTDEFDQKVDNLISVIEKYIDNKSDISGYIYIQSFAKFLSKLTEKNKLTKLLELMKKYEKINMIIVETSNQMKPYIYETWFTQNFNASDGIWIGKGLSDQALLRISNVSKEMTLDYKNDMGYIVSEGSGTLVKLIDYFDSD